MVDAVLRRRRGGRFWWLVLRNTAVLSAVAVAVGWSVAFRQNWGSWPFLDIGSRITWCDQDYLRTVTDLTLTEVNLDQQAQVEPIFAYPPPLPRGDVLARPVRRGCPDRLFVRVAADRYSGYLASSARP